MRRYRSPAETRPIIRQLNVDIVSKYLLCNYTASVGSSHIKNFNNWVESTQLCIYTRGHRENEFVWEWIADPVLLFVLLPIHRSEFAEIMSTALQCRQVSESDELSPDSVSQHLCSCMFNCHSQRSSFHVRVCTKKRIGHELVDVRINKATEYGSRWVCLSTCNKEETRSVALLWFELIHT